MLVIDARFSVISRAFSFSNEISYKVITPPPPPLNTSSMSALQ